MSGERVPAALSRKVRERAKEVCEYCRLPQSEQEERETPNSADVIGRFIFERKQHQMLENQFRCHRTCSLPTESDAID